MTKNEMYNRFSRTYEVLTSEEFVLDNLILGSVDVRLVASSEFGFEAHITARTLLRDCELSAITGQPTAWLSQNAPGCQEDAARRASIHGGRISETSVYSAICTAVETFERKYALVVAYRAIRGYPSGRLTPAPFVPPGAQPFGEPHAQAEWERIAPLCTM